MSLTQLAEPVQDFTELKSQAGVKGFWRQCMLNNKVINRRITDRDRPILQYLSDVVLQEHQNDYGFDLAFMFEPNAYFQETCLKK